MAATISAPGAGGGRRVFWSAESRLKHLRLLLGFAFPLCFGEGVHLRRGFEALLAAQNSFDGKDLDFGKIFVVDSIRATVCAFVFSFGTRPVLPMVMESPVLTLIRRNQLTCFTIRGFGKLAGFFSG